MHCRMWKFLPTAGTVALAAFLAVPLQGNPLFPPGPPGPTMKRLDQVSSSKCIDQLPFTIDQPGTYTVCNDLMSSEGAPGIIVNASGVTIDLGGFTLTGGEGSRVGISVDSSVRDVTIKNGTIFNWLDGGVAALGAENLRCEDLTVRACGGPGIAMSSGTVERCELSDNTGDGISVSCPGGTCPSSRPVRCVNVNSSNNGGAGISSTGVSLSLEHCVTNDNFAHGIHVLEDDSPIPVTLRASHCLSSGNGSSGVHSVDVPFDMDHCVMSRNSSHGVYQLNTEVTADRRAKDYNSTRSNRRRNSVCDGNGGDGIRIEVAGEVEVDMTLSDDSCSSNAGSGVAVVPVSEGSSGVSLMMERCETSRNGAHGLHLANCPHDLRHVTSSGNASAGVMVEFADLSSGGRRAGYNNSRSNKAASISSSGNGGAGFAVLLAGEVELDYSIFDSSISNNGAHGVCMEEMAKFSTALCPSGSCVVDAGSRISLHVSNTQTNGNEQNGLMMDFSEGDDSITVTCACEHLISSGNGGSGVLTDGLSSGHFSHVVTSLNGGHGIVHRDVAARAGSKKGYDYYRCRSSSNAGDGLRCETGASITADHCRFDNNDGTGSKYLDLDDDGDGIPTGFSAFSSSFSGNGEDGLRIENISSVSLDSCDARGNTEAGVFAESSGEISMKSCSSSGNGGAGAHLDASSYQVSDSSFARNDNGGLWCWGSGFVSNSVVSNNDSGGLWCWGSGRIHNNIVSDNDGDGITLDGVGFVVVNNSLSGHIEGGGGGGHTAVRVSAPGTVVNDNLFVNNDQATSLIEDSNPLYTPAAQRENPLYNE